MKNVRFIIINQPGKAPIKKGPLGSDAMVAQFLGELPKYHPGATLTVAEIAPGPDLWLTSSEEWLLTAAHP